jgi:hypothetical protein
MCWSVSLTQRHGFLRSRTGVQKVLSVTHHRNIQSYFTICGLRVWKYSCDVTAVCMLLVCDCVRATGLMIGGFQTINHRYIVTAAIITYFLVALAPRLALIGS